MGRVMLRILQIALTAVGGLLVVPIAVNVGTSGDAPDWLRPYAGWLWPVAIVCVLLVIALEIWDKVRVPKGAISARHPHDPRNTGLALAQVARYVEERQRGSLAERVRLALALDERPSAVRQPGHLVQRVSGAEFQLAADLGIADIFEQMNESMLLLGAPGSGKTTLLLDLAAELVVRARAAGRADPAIPVVVDLAEWSRSARRQFPLLGVTDSGPRDFVGWLLTCIWDRYRIPEVIGRAWLRENRFTFLMDGLDEVREADRERCVEEINNLQSQWEVTRLAVCSRDAEYHRLALRLRLQGATVIRPLTRDQVNAYFATVSPRLAGISDALAADGELWELLTTPLMLNIMTLAQGDRTWQALAGDNDPAERRRLLFDAYVVEVLARRRSHERSDPERTLRAIRTLAIASTRLDSGVRVVRLDSDTAERGVGDQIGAVMYFWMFPASVAIGALVSATTMGLRFSAAAGVVAAALGSLTLLMSRSFAPPRPSSAVNGAALAGYLIAVAAVAVGLVLALTWIVTLAELSPTLVAGMAFGLALLQAVVTWLLMDRDFDEWRLLLATTAGGAVVAATVLLFGIAPSALAGWAIGVAEGGILMTLLFLVEMTPGRPDPDSAVRRVLTIQTVLCALVAVAAPLAVADSWITPFWLPMAGWLTGLAYAYLPSGMAWLGLVGPYFRAALVIAGEPVPWRSAFLRFAADRSLLTLSDGGYRFIHLLVRDHLAQCEPTQLAHAVLRRRAELGALVPSSRA